MTFTEWLKKWWFLFSAATIALLYFLYDRRGRTIAQLKENTQRQLMGVKLKKLNEQSLQSEEDYDKAQKEYDAIKLRHADLLHKLGISSSK